MFFSGVKSTKL